MTQRQWRLKMISMKQSGLSKEEMNVKRVNVVLVARVQTQVRVTNAIEANQ